MLTRIVVSFRKLNWSVTNKINLCLALLVLIMFVSSVLVFFSIQFQQEHSRSEQDKNAALTNIEIFDKLLNNTLNIFNDVIYLSQFKAPISNKYQSQVNAILEKVKETNPEQMRQPDSLLTKIIENTRQLEVTLNQANTLLQNAQSDEVIVLWASSLDLRRTLSAQTNQLYMQLEQEQKNAAQASKEASEFTQISTFIAGLLGSLFAILCGWLLASTIGKPLAATRKFLEEMSEGDLTSQLSLENRDELGDLAQVLNVRVKTLRGIVESFNIGAQVEVAARNLRQISSDQAKHSSNQVEQITQISNALQELTSFAKAINENANMVVDAANITLTQAQQVNVISTQVGEIMQHLQTTVDNSDMAISRANSDFAHLIEQLRQLDNQSQNTQAVVNITADIAKKIHLLSLNAAIEAAGAGQQGERFRQVASQIKELATHSNNSAKNIGELLSGIRQSAQQTVSSSLNSQDSLIHVVELSSNMGLLAKETSVITNRNQEAVQEILTASAHSAQQATLIKNAIQQQQLSSQQILSTVDTISNIIRLTAQRSNEVANTSSELNAMSRSLAERLAELKLPTLVS